MTKNIISTDELLRMSEDDYMNEVQLDFFKKRLLELERELLENAQQTTNSLREQETNYIADESDRATIEEEHILELKSRDRERRLLQKVRNALELISEGEYGYCEDSGDQIGLKRLLARPTATFTVEAQEVREKQSRHFADM